MTEEKMGVIPETISEVLDVLAKKFGATGEKLWEAIVKQQYIDGYFFTLVPIAAVFYDLIVAPILWKHVFSLTCAVSKYEEIDCSMAIAYYVGFIGFTLLFNLYAIYRARVAATCLLNPTYSALQDVTAMLPTNE